MENNFVNANSTENNKNNGNNNFYNSQSFKKSNKKDEKKKSKNGFGKSVVLPFFSGILGATLAVGI